MAQNDFANQVGILMRSALGVPIMVVLLLVMMILPLPPFILDVLFTFNITLSLVILLTSIYILRPLDFNVFPTIILVATLLRLALNLASTRVVLLHGQNGPGAAGEVIRAFGEVVVGGNFTVGFVVFIILVIINFVVITKGAGRISEVSARFVLDAMPGKQMSIDADLNAGIINQAEAKIRRQDIAREADFYGSMDGASKFVRGDAVAGLLVLFINVIGGVSIGVIDHKMAVGEAMRVYALLTIGDGLVAQIPALLLSVTSAIMVTRANTAQDVGKQITSQILTTPRPFIVTAIILLFLGLIPGMPHLAFVALAAMTMGAGYWITGREALPELEEIAEEQQAQAPVEKELNWDDVKPVDPLSLEIGYRLITLVGVNKDGPLVTRVRGIRKKLSQELGFLIPSVHIRDNLELQPSNYRIALMNVTYGEAEIMPNHLLAINPGQVFGKVEGVLTKDPTFGLEALWITPNNRDHAQSIGYTVVDPSTVIATHLSQIIQDHASDLLGHEETQQLLNRLKVIAPKLVDAATAPGGVPLNTVVRVLQRLLKARIPIIDMKTIMEALVEHAGKTDDSEVLTSIVRVALSRLIIQKINGSRRDLSVAALAPGLEQLLLQSQQKHDSNAHEAVGLEPGLAEQLLVQLSEYAEKRSYEGSPAIVIVANSLRSWLEKFVRISVPDLFILAYSEIPDDKQLHIIATIGQN